MVNLNPENPMYEEAVGKDSASRNYPRGHEPMIREWNDATRETYAIPTLMRVELPMSGQLKFRRIADLLHGLATSLDVLSRRTDISEVEAMLCVAAEIRQTNQKIKVLTKSRRAE